MYIDGRGISVEDTMKKMREIARTQCGTAVDLEVEVDTKEDAMKIKGFASMTGCKVEIKKKNTGYLMNISGTSCKCG